MTATAHYHARHWLATTTICALVLALVAVVATLVGMLWPDSWQSVGSAAKLRTNMPQLLNVAEREFYLVWQGSNPIALSTRDPHGPYDTCIMPIRFEATIDQFIEPCGGSMFYADGSYLRGPSPRSMDRYPMRINQGRLEVNTDTIVPGQAHF